MSLLVYMDLRCEDPLLTLPAVSSAGILDGGRCEDRTLTLRGPLSAVASPGV
jgi:hypothetical protein